MSLKKYDDLNRTNNIKLIAGFDEAGRGPLCGPVVAAGVIMDPNFYNELINDSKKLTEKKREECYELIIKNAIDYMIVSVSPQLIDRINILEASRLGMQLALDEMLKNNKIDLIMTDYMKLKTDLPILSLKHGDATSFSIACASILAKVTRDRYMKDIDQKYPQYEFAKHKGYPTKRHLELLDEYGPLSDFYRFSYGPLKKYRK